jgi:hypothetical protein
MALALKYAKVLIVTKLEVAYKELIFLNTEILMENVLIHATLLKNVSLALGFVQKELTKF